MSGRLSSLLCWGFEAALALLWPCRPRASPCDGASWPSAGAEALSLQELQLVGPAVASHGLQSLLGVWDLLEQGSSPGPLRWQAEPLPRAPAEAPAEASPRSAPVRSCLSSASPVPR